MKHLVVAALISFMGTVAHADFVPGRFQPISRTLLTQVDENGVELPGRTELVLLQEDGKSQPTRATHEGIFYFLDNQEVDGCGNQVLKGVSNLRFLQTVTIVDHSKSLCDVAYPAILEVTVEQSGTQTHYRGNPESIFSITDDLR